MKYYLKTTSTLYYDGHGTPDDGGIIKEVVKSETPLENYSNYDDTVIDQQLDFLDSTIEAPQKELDTLWDSEKIPQKFINMLTPEQLEEYNEISLENIELYAQDGYNCGVEDVIFKEITHLQYIEYSDIIRKYEGL